MKKLSKLFAMLLTVCLIVGIVAVVASATAPADKTTHTVNGVTYNYTFDGDDVGKNYNSSFPSGTGSAGECSATKVVAGADENKYVSYSYVKDATNKAYRRDFRYGGHSTTMLNDYSYVTVDFDITADKYKVMVGHKVLSSLSSTTYTYFVQPDWMLIDDSTTQADIEAGIIASKTKLESSLADVVKKLTDGSFEVTGSDGKTTTYTASSKVNGTYPKITTDTVIADYVSALEVIDYAKAISTKRLAYSEGAYFETDNRAKNSEGTYTSGGYAKFRVYFKYDETNKVWNICSDSAGKTVLAQLSNELGAWNHFTYAFQAVETVVTEASGDTPAVTTMGYSMAQVFFNGEPIFNRDYLVNEGFKRDLMLYINLRAFDFQIVDYATVYSMGLDNIISTYYEEGYTSGDSVYGIDDLFAESTDTTPIIACEDVLFDTYYEYPAPSNAKSATVNGGEKIYNSRAVAYQLLNTRGGTVSTELDLLDMTPMKGADFTVVCASDVKVTLSAESAETHSIEKTATGYSITSNQLALPTLGSGEDLVYGNYAYTDFESGQGFANWAGSHGLGISGTTYNRIGDDAIGVNPYNGNKYLTIRRNNNKSFANNGTNAYIEYSLSHWANNSADRYKGNLLGRYDFVVTDFDFGTDAYQLMVGYRVVKYDPDSKVTGDEYYKIEKAYRTYTPAELTEEAVEADIAEVHAALLADTAAQAANLNANDIEKYTAIEISYESAIATKTLAYVQGANFYMGMRNYATEGLSTQTNTTNCFLHTACVDGVWGLYKSSTFTAANLVCELPENPYELVHVTYVVAVDQATKKVEVYCFVDGKLASSVSHSDDHVAKCLDCLRLQMPKDYKDEDAYSYAFDNVTVNYYEKGYTSGEAYGIDDYVKAGDFTAPIYDATDIVYNRGYVSPNGFVQVDGGELSYITPVINAALADVQDASSIYTSKQIYNFTPDPSVEIFDVLTVNGGMLHLSDEALKHYIVEDEGEGSYTIRVASEKDAITLEWYNSEGKLIKSEILLPNVEANTDNVDASIFDVATRTYTYVTAWKWDINGDSVYEPVGSFGNKDGLGGKVIKAIPEVATQTVSKTYAIYYTDELGVTKLHGNPSDYNTEVTLVDLVATAPSGSTVIIYQDVLTVDYKTVHIPAGKNISVDLNGKKLYHAGTASKGDWGYPLFAVAEGATFNLYSSVSGGEIYQARWRDDKSIYTGYPSVISTSTNADNVVINVGKYGDYSGDNLSIYSGTVFSQVATSITSESAPLSDSETVVFNIDGGKYYEFIDTSYSLIKIATPDVIMNIRNADFYCSKGSVLWTDDRYHCENAHVFFYNCEIYAETTDGAMAGFVSKFHGEGSTLYLEGNKIFGYIANFANNKVYVGPGNEIAWNLGQSTDYDYLVYASYVDGEFVEDVTYANVNNDAYVLSFKGFALPTLTPDAENNNYLLGSSFNSLTAIERTACATVITFKTSSVPSNVRNVTWLDVDGDELTSCYWVVGSVATAPEHSGVDVADNYFTKSYSWMCENGDATDLTVGEGTNVFKPFAAYSVSKIGGMKANMDLLTSMSFNLYLPKSDKIEGLTVTAANGEAMTLREASVLGADMYYVAWQQAINDFGAMEITVSYTVDGTALYAKVSLDPIKYATIVASTFECGSEEAVLAYEIINYKAAVATYLDPDFANAAYDEFLTVFAAHENCTCASTAVEISEEESAVDYSNLDVQWVQYALSIEQIGMIIKADPSAEVSVSYVGPDGNDVVLPVEYDENNEYFIVSAVKAAYIDEIMYITVNDNTGTYCLGKFIENTGFDVAKAIYTYAVAAENYKHVTASESAE